MTRIVWTVVSVILAGIVALTFFYPHELVSPGNVIPAHRSIERSCFACHTPFRGASPQRCMACHKLPHIGLRTTKGEPILRVDARPPFHQALQQGNCTACHSDHASPRLTGTVEPKFDHGLLKPAARGNCQSCHQAPRDALHQGRKNACVTCHQTDAWRPATFDHRKFFALDRHHNVTCTTCHQGGTYRQYTCYGCHEHQPARILAEHREEGITNIANCAGCHRSADGEAGEHAEGRARDDD